MLKRTSFFAILAFIPMILHAEALPELTNQLHHLRTEIDTIKRAWNSARIRIKMAEKASPKLYQSTKPIFERIIASNEFVTKMNEAVAAQFEAIVNRYMSFASVKATPNVSDYVPNLSMQAFGQNLFSAMANKEYCLLLGQKIASKAQELQATISSTQTPLFLTID